MKNVFRFIGYVLLVQLLIYLINLSSEKPIKEEASCTDYFEPVNNRGDRKHERSWQIPSYLDSFCAQYNSFHGQSKKAGNLRAQIKPEGMEYEKYWGSVYKELVSSNTEDIRFLADSLVKVARLKNLTNIGLADLVVSFVQDIPYSYIHSKECSEKETSKHPCVPYVKYGILSPYEFIHTLKGDCDTRSVLIYALLKEMNFDPMIVISQQYAHAMLAVNMPTTGDHLTFRGKNYYFWETTAKDWPVGELPPSWKNVNYWKVALVNEL